MERSMYEDETYNAFPRENVAQLKRKFTLDLSGKSTKKSRLLGTTPNLNPVLTSPDLKMLKLASPELDKLVIQQGGFSTPDLYNAFSFPKVPMSCAMTVHEDELHNTLEHFHKEIPFSKEQPIIVSTASLIYPPTSSHQLHYTQLVPPTLINQQQVPAVSSSADDSSLVMTQIKEEPQTVPSVCGSPPVSPINMESQEKIKLERKRLRNRIAASKCRKRKLERISRLEDKVRSLKGENSELQNVVNKLKHQVCALKQEVIAHCDSGCQLPIVTN